MRTIDVVAFAIAVVLGGCAASGVQVTEQQAQSFQVGRSTYSDVVAALGEPTEVSSSSNGNRVAVYSYSAVASDRRILFRTLVRISQDTTASRAR